MSAAFRILLVLFAATGWWVSLDLARLASNLTATNPWLAAQCGPPAEGGPSPCQALLRSNRSSSFGIPWVALGMAYFSFILVWALFVGPPERGRRLWAMPVLAVLLLGSLISLLLIGMMASDLRQWCAGCVAVHCLNGLILLVFVVGLISAPKNPEPRPRASLALASLTAGSAVAVVQVLWLLLGMSQQVGGQVSREYRKIVDDPAYARWRYERQPVMDVTLRPDDHIFGSPTAPHTLVAFLDFQCPHCQDVSKLIEEKQAAFPDQMRVVYRHFPQDPACNPEPRLKAGGYAHACAAAIAAEAAAKVGGDAGFAAMKSLLYSRQRDLETRRFAEWALELKMDPTAFTAALADPALLERVRADVESARQLGVTTVPGLVLDGRKLENWSNPKTWDALVGGAADSQPAGTAPKTE